MKPTRADVDAGQAVYTRRTLSLYDLVVLGISNRFIWKCPTDRIVAHYDRHASANHLDVGVGTGYFLDRCRFPSASPRVALMDLNASSLDFAAGRIARYRPERYTQNVLEAVTQAVAPFDSVGVNYLFHCLPGAIGDKAVALDHLKAVMRPGATLFGSTILQGGVERGWSARRLMGFYNRRGIFSNAQDTADALEAALRRRFDAVAVDIVGCVALFSGRVPSGDVDGAAPTPVAPPPLTNPVRAGTLRVRDDWGEGHFGAARGPRCHNGVDIVALPGAEVCSPIDARLVRIAYPYDDDASLAGVLLEGLGDHAGRAVKLFYVAPDPALIGQTVRAGQPVGQAQSLQARYPGITDHIHLELREDGAPVDPWPLIAPRG